MIESYNYVSGFVIFVGLIGQYDNNWSRQLQLTGTRIGAHYAFIDV